MDTASRQRRILAAVPGVALLLCGVGFMCSPWLTSGDEPARPGTLELVPGASPASEGPDGAAPFAAAGRVAKLQPGQVRTVEVKVTNPDEVPYRILRLTATPEGADRDCPGESNVVVSGYDAAKAGAATYVVPRRSTITIPLTLMMLNAPAAGDACPDTDLPLSVAGLVSPETATRAAANGRH